MRRLSCVMLVALAMPASARADGYAEELERWLGFLNKDCDTAIKLEPPNVADLKAKGASPSFCNGLFDELRRYCKQDSGKPHPAAQAFLRQHVKTLSCRSGPDADKPVVQVSLRSGVLAISTTPGFGAQGVAEAMRKEPTLAKIWPARRLWDLDNVQLPEASQALKKACGDDTAMTIDVPSWQARGYLLDYPDQAAADICANYAHGIVKACEGDKAKTRARVTGIRCGLLPAAKEHDPPRISIANKQVVVMLGTLGSSMVESGAKVFDAVAGKK